LGQPAPFGCRGFAVSKSFDPSPYGLGPFRAKS
jgi:hypothetical protein